MLLLNIALATAQPHVINVRFWLDKEFQNPYIDQTLKVYFENRTAIPSPFLFEYEKVCWWADYDSGVATIYVNQTGTYDLIITDGMVTWDNETNCPKKIENYMIWATVQSGMYIDHSEDLDYYINITIEQEQPRTLFFGHLSMKAFFSAIIFLIIIGLSLLAGYYLKSGVAIVVTFIGLLLIKIILGL